jgi:hypothetical protein
MNHADLLVAYAALTEKHKQTVEGRKRMSRAARRARGRGNKRQKGADTTTTNATTTFNSTCDHYCYLHGKQNSHNSAQCKVMENDRGHFTAAMRHAKTSNAVAGGSKAVKGKPVAARGFMMMDVGDSDDLRMTTAQRPQPPTM